MDEREYILAIIAGGRNVGKSTFTFQQTELIGRRTIVVNKGELSPRFDNWQKVTVEQLKTFKGDNVVVQIDIDQVNEVCETIMHYKKGSSVVFEDAKRYIPQSIGKGGLNDLISDLRKCSCDVFFQYHCLKHVPPFIADMYNMLVLFKTTDYFTKSDLKKFANTETIIKCGERIKRHKDPHYCETIFVHE
ncbi:hypothetical protein ACFOW1_09560 [Parasediminibacterium paludis]|uniref:Uncharacterized protein n=1 Tax=Parasediminibacterium paludis TaxID=908966 RepID=A0ABV8PVV4_9BACT